MLNISTFRELQRNMTGTRDLLDSWG
jgi:hypothetical protein